MMIAVLGIYIAVEKMDITPIATVQADLQLATPVDTSSSFSCTAELYVDSSKSSWVKDYNGDFFRLKNPNNYGTQWYCIEAGGTINGLANRTYPQVYATWNGVREDHYFCGHGAPCPGYNVPIEYTCPYFVCVGEHYTQDSSYTNYSRRNPFTGESVWKQSHLYNVSYIITYQNSDDLMYEIDQETYEKTYEIMEDLPSDDPNGWSGAKQHAIWKSIISHNKKSDAQLQSYHQEFVKQGAKLYDEATAFNKYYSYIKNSQYPEDGSVDKYPAYIGEKEVGFGLKDETNNDGVYTFVDQEPQGQQGKVKYTIGPFKINYVNGTMTIMCSYLGTTIEPYTIGFSGMTEAYLLDDKGNRIEINKFIITKDTYGRNYSPHLQLTPQYFSTLNEDGSVNENLIDRYACKYKTTSGKHVIFNKATGEGQGYPFPLEEFYIEFYATEEMSTKVKVHMDFKWLDTSMQICLKEGRKYYSYYAGVVGSAQCGYPVLVGWDSGCAGGCDEEGNCWSYCWSYPIYEPCPSMYHTHEIRVDRSHYVSQQDNMEVVSAERIQHDESIELDNNGQYFDLTMQIGGFVWEDMNAYSKQGASVDGIYTRDDEPYKGIEVILHEYGKNNNEFVRRTVTDANGYYMFKNVDSRKKYYVEFVFDGQKYENTIYDNNVYTSMLGYKSNATETTNTNKITQNTNDKITCNARDQYNQRFEEIGSYPENYKVRNPIKAQIAGKLYQIGDYNTSYNWTEMQLVRGTWTRVESDIAKIYDAVRTEAARIAQISSDGRIGNVQDPYTEAYKNIADKMQKGTVEGLAGKRYTKAETASMLQFLEDRRLSAYTGENGLTGGNQRYYVLKEYSGKFLIATRNEVDDSATANNLTKTGIHRGNGSIQIGLTVYTPIYDGAYRDYSVKKYREYIDARKTPSNRAKDNEIKIPSQLRIDYGITRRVYTDAALTQDLFKVTTKINGKTQVYDYNVREVDENEFHIEQRVDSGDYYNIKYDRGLYKSDWLYSADMYEKNALNTNMSEALWETIESAKSTTELEVYATYRVTINNQGNTNIDIQEIVDYYDEEYIFEPNLSFTVYNDSTVDKDNFYDAMHNSTLVNRGGTTALTIYENGRNIESYMRNGTGRVATTGLLQSVNANYRLGRTIEYNAGATQIEQYGVNPSGYDSVYMTTPQGTQLRPGEKLYAYLTFRVKRAEERSTVILHDAEVEAKHNVTEINGYKTYYNAGTRLSRYNGQNEYRTRNHQVAGVIDTDSTPGNVTAKEPAGSKHDIEYVRAYEDDTDRASDFTVTLYTDPRKMNGYVWEDERTVQSANAMVGDGIRDDENEDKINGVTVQLVELIDAGEGNYYEYIWKEVSSGGDVTEAVIPGADNQGSAAEDGRYEFNNFITGNYIVRFKYGDTYKTALSTGDGNYSYDTDASKINAALGSLAQNATSYNGQDYKSTTYQSGLEQLSSRPDEEEVASTTTGVVQGNVTTADPVILYGEAHGQNLYGYTDYTKQNTTGSYIYDIGSADNKQNLSDAKDIYTGYTQQYDRTTGVTTDFGGLVQALNRQDVIDYSNNEVTNHKAEVLASAYEIPNYNGTNYSTEQIKALVDELVAYTQMRAETGIIDVEYEYNRRVSNAAKENNATIEGEIHFGAGAVQVDKDDADKGYTNGNDKNGTYVLSNIDFGLQQRPQAQLELDKRVNNVKVTLANGIVLFDASQKATNVLWLEKGEHTVDRTDGTSDSLLGIITAGNVIDFSEKGKIQLTMDEEIMHGATIQITYQLQVENTGEYDYNNTQFYYTGTINRGDIATSMVTTKVDELVDYINNNMEYRQVDNEYIDDDNTNTASSIQNNKWEVIGKDTLITAGSNYQTNANLVNVNLQKQVKEFNTIVHITESPFLDALKTSRNQDNEHKNVASTRSIQLLLTQTLDPESDTDEMTYANIAEIAKTSNTVGRRMAVSVVGNQDPEKDIAEIDADVSEDVVILPPFGDDQSQLAIWTIIGVAVVALLGTGIILIKRLVIKK